MADYLAALSTRRIGTLRTSLGMQASSLVLVAIGATALGQVPPLSVETIAIAFGMGALGAVMLAALYRALAVGPIAIVSPVVAANAAVTVVLAVALLGERLSTLQLVAIVATIAGIALASTDLRIVRETLGRPSLGVRLALLTMVGFGVLGFLLATVSRSYGALSMVFLLRAGTTALLAVFAVARRTSPLAPRVALGVVVLVGVLDTGGNLAYGYGATLGYASIVATASSAYPLIPFVLGVTVLRERIAPNQLGGVALLLAGLLILGGA
ncbi:MAG: hypothetical protein AUH85_05950, partial [Chloroflexi bacterium 13_1_40CM_4_68_4]